MYGHKEIKKFVWYDSKYNFIELWGGKQIIVNMRKKDMYKLAIELGVEFEIRHRRK